MITEYSPAQVIHKLLLDAELISDPRQKTDWAGFIGSMPDGDNTPDSAIAVYDTAGIKDGRFMRTGETVIHPGINIRVRAVGYPDSRKKAAELFNFLDGVDDVVVEFDVDSSFKVVSFSHTSDITSLGEQETRNRHSFTLNGIITIEAL